MGIRTDRGANESPDDLREGAAREKGLEGHGMRGTFKEAGSTFIGVLICASRAMWAYCISKVNMLADRMESRVKHTALRSMLLTTLAVVVTSAFVICLCENASTARLFLSNVTTWAAALAFISVATFSAAMMTGGSGSFNETVRTVCLCSFTITFFFVPYAWAVVLVGGAALFVLFTARIHRVRSLRSVVILSVPSLVVSVLALAVYSPYSKPVQSIVDSPSHTDMASPQLAPPHSSDATQMVAALFAEGKWASIDMCLDSLSAGLRTRKAIDSEIAHV